MIPFFLYTFTKCNKIFYFPTDSISLIYSLIELCNFCLQSYILFTNLTEEHTLLCPTDNSPPARAGLIILIFLFLRF